MDAPQILARLPYDPPFLFVDELIRVDENGVEGCFTFREDLDFYKGHFKENPVTPGVILTETMAQIGVVCLGIFLMNDELTSGMSISLTSADIEFLKTVYPNERVTVISEKIYFRFGKLKCKVVMKNQQDKTVCQGVIAGMIVSK